MQSGRKQAANEFLRSESTFLHGLDLDVNYKADCTKNNGVSSCLGFSLGEKFRKGINLGSQKKLMYFYETYKTRGDSSRPYHVSQRKKNHIIYFESSENLTYLYN